jgi:hypothetical protein
VNSCTSQHYLDTYVTSLKMKGDLVEAVLTCLKALVYLKCNKHN